MNVSPRALQTPNARRKLRPAKEPYWADLRRGLAIGYYRGTDAGTWWLREYRNGKYVKRRLGAADDDVKADGVNVLSWDDAKKLAGGEARPTVTKPGRYTVDDAADAYFEMRAKKGDVTRDRATYNSFIKPTFGARAIADLTTSDFNRWLASQVPDDETQRRRKRSGEVEPKEARRRAQATANRRWTLLRAILNAAYRNEPSKVPNADAWRRVKPFERVDRPRQRFLSLTEAKRLLNALAPDVRALAQGALYTGLRLGELVALRVAHVGDGYVHVVHSKSGRARTVPLSKEGRAFFAAQIAGKLGDEPVFPRFDGGSWSRAGVSRAMRAACETAKIKPPATFHDLRRSYGSLLLNAGAPAEVVQELLGHADLRMTRRAYAHLLDATLAQAVEKHLPEFGFAPGGNVRTLGK